VRSKGGSSKMFGCFAFGESGSVVLRNPGVFWCESDPGFYGDEATESAGRHEPLAISVATPQAKRHFRPGTS
jgi:hypothetical protein